MFVWICGLARNLRENNGRSPFPGKTGRRIMAELKITWVKSGIGRPENQRRIIKSLGLRRLHHAVVHQDSPTIRGMVNKVSHLVMVEEA